MDAFQEMARKARKDMDESMIQMTDDGYLLIVSDKGGGNFSCQAMDETDQGTFMERLHLSADFQPPLKAPYSEQRVEAYETAHSVKIPYLLRHYMTHVSSESCCDPLRGIVDIEGPPEIKVLVSKDADSDRKECRTMQFTGNKLAILDVDMEGLIVIMDNQTQGAFHPLWMSIFFPNRQSGVVFPKDDITLVQAES